jgi:hypothetical protein
MRPRVRCIRTILDSFIYAACPLVVMTDNTVRDLYPEGANGILGYGVNLPTGVDKSASLIDSFLPYVISLRGSRH